MDDPQIAHFFKPYPKLECDKVEKNWLKVENGFLKYRENLNAENSELKCTYTGFKRGVDDNAPVVMLEKMRIFDNFPVRFMN